MSKKIQIFPKRNAGLILSLVLFCSQLRTKHKLQLLQPKQVRIPLTHTGVHVYVVVSPAHVKHVLGNGVHAIHFCCFTDDVVHPAAPPAYGSSAPAASPYAPAAPAPYGSTSSTYQVQAPAAVFPHCTGREGICARQLSSNLLDL
jgi:hypothetical protein